MRNEELLTMQEEVELFQRAKAGDRTAFERLVLSNLGLVRSTTKRYTYVAVFLSPEDLCQYGIIGLILAVTKFDERKGFKFSSYAVWWIRQVILLAISDFGFMVRVPMSVVSKLGRLKAITGESFEDMDVCGEDFIAASKAAGFLFDEVVPAVLAKKQVFSLNAPVLSDNDGGVRGELAEFTSELSVFNDPIERMIRRERVEGCLGCLRPNEREVISLRFGLRGGEEMTLDAIGSILGVTKERVRQIEERAIRRMRKATSEEIG